MRDATEAFTWDSSSQKQTKAYYEAVSLFARGETVAPQTDAERRRVRYSVEMDVYLGERQRGDSDNFLKCGLDALVKCGCDSYRRGRGWRTQQVRRPQDERDNPRTIYQITRLENPLGQN